MSFIDSDEYMILMDYQTVDGILMDGDDLKALRDAGIRTAVMFTSPWASVEPRMGKYDWSSVDRYLERVYKYDYKALIACYSEGPGWLPAEWCAMTAAGYQRGVISPWNKDAVAYQLDFMRRMRDRYNDPGRALVYNSWMTNGETLFLNEPAWFDPCARESWLAASGCNCEPVPGDEATEIWYRDSLLDLLLAQQAIFVENADREVWTAAHPVLAQIYGNGNRYIEDYFRRLKTELEPCNISHIYYTWIQWPGVWSFMNMLTDLYGSQGWGGAEYCEGLPTTTPAAIANGLRGQIIGPLHPFTGHAHVEPWMVERIQWAMGEWSKGRAP